MIKIHAHICKLFISIIIIFCCLCKFIYFFKMKSSKQAKKKYIVSLHITKAEKKVQSPQKKSLNSFSLSTKIISSSNSSSRVKRSEWTIKNSKFLTHHTPWVPRMRRKCFLRNFLLIFTQPLGRLEFISQLKLQMIIFRLYKNNAKKIKSSH